MYFKANHKTKLINSFF